MPDPITRPNGFRGLGATLTVPARAVFVSLATAIALACANAGPRGDRVLIMIVDGLRPEYVTAEVMPRLSALRDGGLLGENHHSVFPTVTRVNSSSIATGTYPRAHGMMGNSVYLDWVDADALMIWITEPDATARGTGVGSPETLDVLRSVDAEIGRLLDGLAQRGILESTTILVTADHGFSTRTGTQSVQALLREHGLKRTETDVVVAGGAIHVNEGGEELVREIVRVLQRTPWVGPIFTRGADASTTLGSIDGTLAFSTIAWDHDRSADILMTGNWSSAENEFGFAGEVMEPGVASHGTLSPYDVRTAFIAHGPDIKQGVRSAVPTGNIDLAPTVLALLGLPVPDGMDGRVIDEAFTDGPDFDVVEVDTREIIAGATWSGGSYVVILQKSYVAGTEYVDRVRVERR